MKHSLVFAPMVIALFAGGGDPAAHQAAPTAPSLVGMWAGERVRLDGSPTGIRIQVDCFIARSNEPIRLDHAGMFAMALTFVALRGAAMDGEEDRPKSLLTGRLEKEVLHLTVTPEGSDVAGTFSARKNGKAKLPNCRLRS